MKTEFEYIHFVEMTSVTASASKTKHWECRNRCFDLLGEVRWHSPWRKYCFFIENSMFPAKGDFVVLASGCLTNISEFLTEANELHKLELIKRKKEA